MVGRLPDEEKLRAVVVSCGHPERAIGVNLLDASTGRRHDQIVRSIVEAWQRFYDCIPQTSIATLSRSSSRLACRAYPSMGCDTRTQPC
jgi:hypothetical protein